LVHFNLIVNNIQFQQTANVKLNQPWKLKVTKLLEVN